MRVLAMSYYATYSPVFTGSMDDPQMGARINDYHAFEHLMEEAGLAFDPVTNWIVEDKTSYPQERYALMHGFRYPRNDDEEFYDMYNTFSLNKVAPGYSDLFYRTWTPIAMTCEPCSVVLNPKSGDFPGLNSLAFGRGEDFVFRIDLEPGSIEIWRVPLFDGEEELDESYEWDVDQYRDEKYPSEVAEQES